MSRKAATPKKAGLKNTVLTIDAALVELAKDLGLNLSEIARKAIFEQVVYAMNLLRLSNEPAYTHVTESYDMKKILTGNNAKSRGRKKRG